MRDVFVHIDSGGGGGSDRPLIVNTTHAALLALAVSGQLTKGQKYSFNFQTCFDTNGLVPLNWTSPTVEQLTVTAASASAIELMATSSLHPQDIIEYELDGSKAGASGCTYGFIRKRYDPIHQVEAPFDFRYAQFPRWNNGSGLYTVPGICLADGDGIDRADRLWFKPFSIYDTNDEGKRTLEVVIKQEIGFIDGDGWYPTDIVFKDDVFKVWIEYGNYFMTFEKSVHQLDMGYCCAAGQSFEGRVSNVSIGSSSGVRCEGNIADTVIGSGSKLVILGSLSFCWFDAVSPFTNANDPILRSVFRLAGDHTLAAWDGTENRSTFKAAFSPSRSTDLANVSADGVLWSDVRFAGILTVDGDVSVLTNGLSHPVTIVATSSAVVVLTGTEFDAVNADGQFLWPGTVVLDGTKEDNVTVKLTQITNANGTFNVWRETSRSVY